MKFFVFSILIVSGMMLPAVYAVEETLEVWKAPRSGGRLRAALSRVTMERFVTFCKDECGITEALELKALYEFFTILYFEKCEGKFLNFIPSKDYPNNPPINAVISMICTGSTADPNFSEEVKSFYTSFECLAPLTEIKFQKVMREAVQKKLSDFSLKLLAHKDSGVLESIRSQLEMQ